MQHQARTKDCDLLEAALRELGSFSTNEIKNIVGQARQSSVPVLQFLVQDAIVSPAELDVVSMLMRPTEAIPGYVLTGVLGRGGMGVVYKARQVNLNRDVAIKTVLSSLASDETSLKRFEREAMTIARLSHPNIVHALDFGSHRGRLHFVMEFVQGEDLASRISSVGRLPEEVVWGIAHQIASGLLHASRAGVVHRDIKPANILLVEPPEGFRFRQGIPMAKISDFGLALLHAQDLAHSRLTTQDSTIGSPHYMAPELIEGGQPNLLTDIYSLGATVFHCFNGKAPWEGLSLRQILLQKHNPQALIQSELQDSNPKVVDILHAMMAPNPEDRLRSYEAVMEIVDRRLNELAHGEHSNASPPTSAEEPKSADATADTAEFPDVHLDTASKPKSNAHPTESVASLLTARESLATPHADGSHSNVQQSQMLSKHGKQFSVVQVGGIVMVLAAIAFVAVILLQPGPPDFVAMQPSEQRTLLFDTKTCEGVGTNNGGERWSCEDGWLIASGTGKKTFSNMSQFDFFSFETRVKYFSESRIIVQFGDNPIYALHIEGNQAWVMQVDGSQSEIKEIVKRIEVSENQAGVRLQIQRCLGRWQVVLDEVPMNPIPIVASAESTHEGASTTIAIEVRENTNPGTGGTPRFSTMVLQELIMAALPATQ